MTSKISTVLSVDVGETNLGICLWHCVHGICTWARMPLPCPELHYTDRVKIFLERNKSLREADMLVIEAQPMIGQSSMHVIEACFCMAWPLNSAYRVNPHHVKAFLGHALSAKTYTHARSKANAVGMVLRLASEGYLRADLACMFAAEAKKDDLADSFLQLMYFVCTAFGGPKKDPPAAAEMKRLRQAMLSWYDSPMADAGPSTS